MPDSRPTATCDEIVVPVVQESASLERRTVETGRVVVRSEVERAEERVSAALARTDAEVARVAVGREVAVAPEPRWDGDVLVVPVVEEFLFVEKRLRLVEELHVSRRRHVVQTETDVPLRRTRITVERSEDPDDEPRPSLEGSRQ